MARSGRPARSTVLSRNTESSTKKSNAAGFAKRQSRNASKFSESASLANIYEHTQNTGRRARTNVNTRLGKDEAAEFGVRGDDDEGSGSDDDVRGGTMRARLVGEEGVESDDDEEIDSDEAFGEEDEERFAGFTFASDEKSSKRKRGATARSTSSRTVRFAEVDLNEDSNNEPVSTRGKPSNNLGDSENEEEEEEEEEGMVDLVDILDGKARPYFADDSDDDDDTSGDSKKGKSKKTALSHPISLTAHSDKDEEMASDDGNDSASHEDASSLGSEDEAVIDVMDYISASENDEPDEEGPLEDLSAFISNLEAGVKRKVDYATAGTAPVEAAEERPRKRRFVQDRTEVGEENEFAARLPTGSQKLNLEDLLAPLAAQPSSNLIALKKSTKVLSSNKAGALSAPLPTRTQERLDRQAAYEQTKEEVDKWSATMKHIKEAEHLSFPLQAEKPARVSNLELTAKFKPSNELESAVDRLLKSAQMREQDLQQTEDLKMNHLSPEEVQKRRAELRHMRELTFRADTKAKRIAKIKSKAFRKIRNKQKAKISAALGEGEDDLDDEEVRLKREVERAKERATLRHKNTGKWARAMKERGELDEEQREDVVAMLDRGEKLRRRIRGEASGDELNDESSDNEDADETAIRTRTFEEVQRVKEGDTGDTLPGGKSVFQMKFMQDAMSRDMQQVDRLADDFIKEMGSPVQDEDEDSSREQHDGLAVQRTGGRVVFRPGAPNVGLRSLTSLASDTSSVTLRSTDLPIVSPPEEYPASPTVLRVTPPPSSLSCAKSALPVNPWLVTRDDAGPSKVGRKKNEVIVDKESGALEKSKNKLRKQAKKREEERERAREDAELDISADDVLKLSIPADVAITVKPIKVKPAPKLAGINQPADDDSDVESEVENQEKVLTAKNTKGGVKAFQQRDLVARAFAGDNVVRDFEEAKRREMAADAPKEVDMTLAGWGSWGGAGLHKPKPKPHLIKQVAGVDPRTRADYGKSHVIISERRDKKAAKYLVKDLPHPYTSKAQFERSMSTPLGAEWNTRVGFQRGTLPRVVKKPGVIISPLEKLA